MWRDTFGFSEQAAMNALLEDGLIQRSEDEKLARHFHDIFGLSETAAGVGGFGDGRTGARDNDRLIGIIEAWAQDLLAHGHLCVELGKTRELAALREAFYKVVSAAQNDVQALWIIRVAESRWPKLRPGRV